MRNTYPIASPSVLIKCLEGALHYCTSAPWAGKAGICAALTYRHGLGPIARTEGYWYSFVPEILMLMGSEPNSDGTSAVLPYYDIPDEDCLEMRQIMIAFMITLLKSRDPDFLALVSQAQVTAVFTD